MCLPVQGGGGGIFVTCLPWAPPSRLEFRAWNIDGAQSMATVMLRFRGFTFHLWPHLFWWKRCQLSPWHPGPRVWILLLWHFKAADLMAPEESLEAICSQVHVPQTATCSSLEKTDGAPRAHRAHSRAISLFGQVWPGPKSPAVASDRPSLLTSPTDVQLCGLGHTT